ncbi:MAG TPA: hypothetical protein VGM33_25285 [Baekduia sp.]
MLTFTTDLGTVGLSWTEAGIDHVAMPRRSGVEGMPLAEHPDAPGFVLEAVDEIVALLIEGAPGFTQAALFAV